MSTVNNDNIIETMTKLHKEIQRLKTLQCLPSESSCAAGAADISLMFTQLLGTSGYIDSHITEVDRILDASLNIPNYQTMINRYNALIRCVMDAPEDDASPPLFKDITPKTKLHQFLILDNTKDKKNFLKKRLFNNDNI